ncbi:MAG: ribose 5-phosphate isomerase B [bacterium]|nr:ribose 5-phosphate isomerase B [bacterium]
MAISIALGSDHAGFELKEKIKIWLEQHNYPYRDFGCYSLESVDYPDYGLLVAEAVARKEYTYGIAVCGSGIGICIVANKVKGIRASLCTSIEMAITARTHNNANVLCLAGRGTDHNLAIKIVETWLTTPFSEEARHQRRIDKIRQIETKYEYTNYVK